MGVELLHWIRCDSGMNVAVIDIINVVNITAVGRLIAKRAKVWAWYGT